MTVAGYQLLVALSVIGAGVWDWARNGTPVWRFRTARNPVALAWLAWTLAIVFMPSLMVLQLVVLLLSYVAASVIAPAPPPRPQRKISKVELALGCLVAALAAPVLVVAGVVIYAVQTWEMPCAERPSPANPYPCDEERREAVVASTAATVEPSAAPTVAPLTETSPGEPPPRGMDAARFIPDGVDVVNPLTPVTLKEGGAAWILDAKAAGSDVEWWHQQLAAFYVAEGYRIDPDPPTMSQGGLPLRASNASWTVWVDLDNSLEGSGYEDPIVVMSFVIQAA